MMGETHIYLKVMTMSIQEEFTVTDTVLGAQDALVSNINRNHSCSFISAAREKQLRGKRMRELNVLN